MKLCPTAVKRHLVVLTILLALLAITTFAHMTPAQASATASTAHSAPYNAEVIASINATFGVYAYQALRVAYCESGYNRFAYNRSSGASGVFQIIPGTWAGTSQRWNSVFNAWANVAAAHEIFVRDGHSWREWACKPW
jgi:hypothetical protein